MAEKAITEHEMIEELLRRITLPQHWGATYQGISAGHDETPSDWIEIGLKNGDLWVLSVVKKDGNAKKTEKEVAYDEIIEKSNEISKLGKGLKNVPPGDTEMLFDDIAQIAKLAAELMSLYGDYAWRTP